MVSMNCLINLWLRALQGAIPHSRPRAYVDDVSTTIIQSDVQTLAADLQKVDTVSNAFVPSFGGKVNQGKCFSFGHKGVAGCIRPGMEHCDEFRLVGGSFVFRETDHVTPAQLELRRLEKWMHAVTRARHLPVSLRDRCGCFSRARTQFTWGTGAHMLAVNRTHEDAITKLRSAVLRCLLRRDQYQVSPALFLTLLVPPSLNPHCCRVVDGLVMFWRVMWATQRFNVFRVLFNSPNVTARDGPIARLRQIDSLPVFQGVVTDMFRRSQHELGPWLHHVQDVWRKSQWTRGARDRPSFRGIQVGIKRRETLALLNQLETDATTHRGVQADLAQENARARAAVLRLLLTGGLLTQDVVTRHKFQRNTDCDCQVGGPQTVDHISWHCAHYDQLRAPVAHLRRRLRHAQPCFVYATIVTEPDADLTPHVRVVESTLVDVWQQHIQNYISGDFARPGDGPPPDNGGSANNSVPRTVADGIHENGHFIRGAPQGGVFCVKCGKHVTEVRHRRLKISSTKCKQAQIPEHHWLSSPNYSSNPHRLLALFLDMRSHCGKHDLAWDGSVSRSEPHGHISCLRCHATWTWRDRHNMKRRDCVGHRRERTPSRWMSMKAAERDAGAAIQILSQQNPGDALSAPHDVDASQSRVCNGPSTGAISTILPSTPAPRRRIVGKAKVSQAGLRSSQSGVSPSHNLLSSSSSLSGGHMQMILLFRACRFSSLMTWASFLSPFRVTWHRVGCPGQGKLQGHPGASQRLRTRPASRASRASRASCALSRRDARDACHASTCAARDARDGGWAGDFLIFCDSARRK